MKALSSREWEKLAGASRHFQGHGRTLLGVKSLHRKIRKSKYWSQRGFYMTWRHVEEACRTWNIPFRESTRSFSRPCNSCGVIETKHESGTCQECRP